MELHFGRAFCIARSRANQRQADVARRAGIDPSYLAAVENGRRKAPSKILLVRLLASIELTASEQKKLELLAALDRMIDATGDETPLDHPVMQVKELLREIAYFGDAELRALSAVAGSFAKLRAQRMEDFP